MENEQNGQEEARPQMDNSLSSLLESLYDMDFCSPCKDVT